jgi:hypothetical protein
MTGLNIGAAGALSTAANMEVSNCAPSMQCDSRDKSNSAMIYYEKLEV